LRYRLAALCQTGTARGLMADAEQAANRKHPRIGGSEWQIALLVDREL